MRIAEFLNDDTCQILLAIIVGIIICYFIFGSSGSCNRDGFSVGGVDFNISYLTSDGQRMEVNGGCGSGPDGLTDQSNVVTAACCNGQGEDCSSGFPATCDIDCNSVVKGLHDQCSDDPLNIFNAPQGAGDQMQQLLDICTQNHDNDGNPFTDACHPDPCGINGSCILGTADDQFNENVYTCNCTGGFTGVNCDTPPPASTDEPAATYEPVCSSVGYRDFIEDDGPLKDACGIVGDSTVNLNEETGLPITCDTSCRDAFMLYYTGCKNSPWAKTDMMGKYVFNALDEFNTLCNPPGASIDPGANSGASTVVVDEGVVSLVARQMASGTYVTLNNNFVPPENSNGRFNGLSDLQEENIYPLVLHAGVFSPKVLLGEGTQYTPTNFTTVHIMMDGEIDSNGQTLGSIGQAVSNLYINTSNTSSASAAREAEHTDFCSNDGSYGGPSHLRVDPSYKVVSLETVQAYPDMCGMLQSGDGSEGLAVLGDGIENYSVATQRRILAATQNRDDGFDAQAYANLISSAYSTNYKIPVAVPVDRPMNIRQGAQYSHIVIHFPSGVPNETGTSLKGAPGKYLVIQTIGLSDNSLDEPAKESVSKTLIRTKQFQYLVNKSLEDGSMFMNANYDPWYSSSGAVSCNGGTCNLSAITGSAPFQLEEPNISCRSASAQIQAFSLMLIQLKDTVNINGYQYYTPDQLITNTSLKVTRNGIIDVTDPSINYTATGSFFIFEHIDGNRYVVPNNITRRSASDVLESTECIGAVADPSSVSSACCLKIFDASNRTSMRRDHPEIWTRCNQVFSGNAPAPAPAPIVNPDGLTPPPVNPDGGGRRYCITKSSQYQPLCGKKSIFNTMQYIDTGKTDGGCCSLPPGCTKNNSLSYDQLSTDEQGSMYSLDFDETEICEQLCKKPTEMRKTVCDNNIAGINDSCCGCNDDYSCPGDN